jgi:small subunit ribosomal protein S4
MAARQFPPGEHGRSRRRKVTDYGRQLQEKQKIRFNYGVSERQLRKLMVEAKRSKMATGNKLLELLERRLDNAVFRAGFAPTIPAARQLVNHGHFRVNGRKVSIASYQVRAGDTIEPKEKSRDLGPIVECLEGFRASVPDWMHVDEKGRRARVVHLPTNESVNFPLDVALVVEFYSKRM